MTHERQHLRLLTGEGISSADRFMQVVSAFTENGQWRLDGSLVTRSESISTVLGQVHVGAMATALDERIHSGAFFVTLGLNNRRLARLAKPTDGDIEVSFLPNVSREDHKELVRLDIKTGVLPYSEILEPAENGIFVPRLHYSETNILLDMLETGIAALNDPNIGRLRERYGAFRTFSNLLSLACDFSQLQPRKRSPLSIAR